MRPHRVDFHGARHHVYNRARHGMPLFETREDCNLFLGLLAQLPEKFGIRVHGYAIMSNHYHLLLESNGNLSKAMQWLFSVFGRRYNARNPAWDGSVWRGRFQSRVADDDGDWMYLLAYTHLNPVRSRCVERPEDAKWTSCKAYMTSAPDWLTTAELLDAYGGPQGLAERTREAHERHLALEPPKVERKRKIQRFLDEGWSIAAIARALKKSRSTIYRWLHGSTVELFDSWGRRLAPGEAAATVPESVALSG